MVALNSNRMWRVFHEAYDICIIPRNQGLCSRVWYRRQEHVYTESSIGLMEPGELHANRQNYRAADFWVLRVEPRLVAAAASQLDLPALPHLRFAITTTPLLVNVFSGFYDALACGRTPLEVDSRLSAALRLMLETCGEERPARPPTRTSRGLERAREYLHQHYKESVRLEALAAVSGLSRFHLAHTFTAVFGLPPHAYQNQLRLAEARRQIRRGTHVRDVEVGFYDQSHLGRHLRRAMGVAPSQYGTPSPERTLPRFA